MWLIDWNPVTKEDALVSGASPNVVYAAQKKLSEWAVWEFAANHPHMEISASTTFPKHIDTSTDLFIALSQSNVQYRTLRSRVRHSGRQD